MRFRFLSLLATLMLFSGAASAAVRVQLGHFAPLSANRDATALTVRVNGTPIASDIRYGDILAPIDLGGTGTYNFTVSFANSTTTLVSGTASAVDGEQFTLLLVGNNVTQPLGLYVLADVANPPAGTGFVRFINAAPYTTGTSAIAIRNQNNTVINGLDNLPYAGATPYVNLAPANYDLRVTTLAGDLMVDPAPITVVANTVRQYVVAGDGVRQPYQFFALASNATGSTVDYSVAGAWTTGTAPGQGISLYPIPGERRLTGAWYTFTTTGQQQWFTLDTCGTPAGVTGCANPNAFDNRTATLTVYQTTGGTFLGSTPTTTRVAGTLTITFQSCTQATASYDVDGRSGTFAMTNLIPFPSCTITAQ